MPRTNRIMKPRMLTVALAALLSLTFAPEASAQTGRRGSIYNANKGPVQLTANKTARRATAGSSSWPRA